MAVIKHMTIYPERGNEKFVAAALLSIVDNPNDVSVESRPPVNLGLSGTVGFRVPYDVFEQFQELMNTPAADEVAETPTPAKRKPGRPKKTEETE